MITVNTITDFLANIIAGARELIINLILALNLPEQTTFSFVAWGLAFTLAWFWFKKWVVTSVFLKFSTIINWVLLSTVFYLVLTRVG